MREAGPRAAAAFVECRFNTLSMGAPPSADADLGLRRTLTPGEELLDQLPRNRVALDQASQEALAKEPHDLCPVPRLHLAEAPVRGKSAVRAQDVQVGMPLEEIPGGGDRDDDAGADILSQAYSGRLGHSLGSRLR